MRVVSIGILFLLMSCAVSKKNDAINTMTDQFAFSVLLDTPMAKVLIYIPSAGCGTTANASCSILVLENGDTIRAINLCDTMSSFEEGQKVKVISTTQPHFPVSINVAFLKTKMTKETWSALHLGKYKTYWAKLIK